SWVWDRALRSLCTAVVGSRVLCCAESEAPRVLPRPRAGRGVALRRRPRAGGRRAAARPLAARERARAPPGRRGALRGVKVPAKTTPGIRMRPVATAEVDVRALEHELRKRLEGEVRFS